MTPERLQQIQELFHAVQEGSAEQRAALLARADPDLRCEVESLLARQSENLLLDRPAVDPSTELVETEFSIPAAGSPSRLLASSSPPVSSAKRARLRR